MTASPRHNISPAPARPPSPTYRGPGRRRVHNRDLLVLCIPPGSSHVFTLNGASRLIVRTGTPLFFGIAGLATGMQMWAAALIVVAVSVGAAQGWKLLRRYANVIPATTLPDDADLRTLIDSAITTWRALGRVL
ncbi:hypothetical protein ACFY4C_40545 [Actinomadura viridis]|uniref:hypothetical protein n=1 Tax=Actinomadura viridis TaxID=58110 RepID=UPI0036A21542